MANTIIYSASAGSGKTFSLVVEYIALLIGNSRAYKNILAVTFTNKATLEMKERILSVLEGLVANDPKITNYREKMIAKGFSHQQIQTNSAFALANILHDYSNFYIETIDSFFQRILRNLAKEIGVVSSFNLLLDDRDYIKQAVKNLLVAAETDRQLMNWLNNFMEERIENGEKWNIEGTLSHFASQNLHKTIVRENINDLSFDINNLISATKQLLKDTNAYITKINQAGRVIKDVCNRYGFDSSTFKGQSKGIYSRFDKLIHFNRVSNDSLAKQEAGENIGVWLKKDDIDSQKEHIIRNELMPLYQQVNELFEEPYRLFFTQCCMLNKIYQTGLLKYIADEKAQLLRENNMFVLQDTPALLSDMLKSTDDISFIYEKTGARFKHIMIDEFQDTSAVSWRNFRLLLQECLSNGNNVFIFGDVKQAIYRWNEGDWSMLNGLINDDNSFSQGLYPETVLLKDNWRTGKTIVDFNNKLFAEAYQSIDKTIAANLEQKAQKDSGQVRACFIETPKGEDKRLNMNEHLQAEIDYYLDCGYGLQDITILCRQNDHIELISDFLKDRNHNGLPYNPVSDEAFAFSSSQDVLTIINSMKFIDNKHNTIALIWLLSQRKEDIDFWLAEDEKGILQNDYLETIRQNKDIPLLELTFAIVKHLSIDENSCFVTAFYDKILLYVEQKGSNLNNFLSYWETDLYNQRIAATKAENNLKITTIHKAKGLEYPVVIVPYCDWKLIQKKEMLWVENKCKIGDVKIFSSSVKRLEQSLYDTEAAQEILAQTMDNTNLLYVALTRAKHSLSLLAEAPKNEERYTNVADLLYDFLLSNNDLAEPYKENEDRFLIGKLPEKETKEQEQVVFLPSLNLNYENAAMALSYKARQHFSTQSVSSSLVRGNLLHRLLSLIITKDDKEKAINQLSLEYDLTKESKNDLERTLDTMFARTDASEWFSEKYKVLTEQSLLTFGNSKTPQMYRPDRIMIGDRETIILDYKFSLSQTHIKEYEEQILLYANLLSRMNYTNISTYLWLVGDGGEDTIIQCGHSR